VKFLLLLQGSATIINRDNSIQKNYNLPSHNYWQQAGSKAGRGCLPLNDKAISLFTCKHAEGASCRVSYYIITFVACQQPAQQSAVCGTSELVPDRLAGDSKGPEVPQVLSTEI
jgi:hypothetical protein